jgi:Cu-Zn family superoxide dismutase
MSKIKAVCIMSGKCTGFVVLEEYGDKRVKIFLSIKNLKPTTSHAFHIHETGDMRNGCTSLKAHYNPHNKNHGGPNDTDRHVGDFGNLTADKNGEVNITFMSDLVKLKGKSSVIGRSFVIHEGIDDLGKGGNKESLETGNAGGRMGCGIIGYAEDSKLYF